MTTTCSSSSDLTFSIYVRAEVGHPEGVKVELRSKAVLTRWLVPALRHDLDPPSNSSGNWRCSWRCAGLVTRFPLQTSQAKRAELSLTQHRGLDGFGVLVFDKLDGKAAVKMTDDPPYHAAHSQHRFNGG